MLLHSLLDYMYRYFSCSQRCFWFVCCISLRKRKPPVRIELTTPGLQDQCSSHWAMEALCGLTSPSKIIHNITSYNNSTAGVTWLHYVIYSNVRHFSRPPFIIMLWLIYSTLEIAKEHSNFHWWWWRFIQWKPADIARFCGEPNKAVIW